MSQPVLDWMVSFTWDEDVVILRKVYHDSAEFWGDPGNFFGYWKTLDSKKAAAEVTKVLMAADDAKDWDEYYMGMKKLFGLTAWATAGTGGHGR